MRIVPINWKTARKFVHDNHRHHEPPVGRIFQIGLKVGNELVGVAICGRPVGSKIDHTKVMDVGRLCVLENMPNACSKLYATCARIAKEMGYESITTYTLENEPGTSLKASGWVCEGKTGSLGKNHGSKNRHRSKVKIELFETIVKYPDKETVRWRKELNRYVENKDEDLYAYVYGKPKQITMTNEIKEEANEVIKPFVFDCILTSTKEKVWKFCYDDQDGLNQHSGVYFKKEHAEKGMADFVSASKDDEITRLKEMLDAAREDEAISFNRWRDGQGWECTLHDDEDVKHWQRYGEGESLTDKELYKRYKNEKL